MTMQGDAPEWATVRARQLVTSSETILGVWVVSDANSSRAAMQPLVTQHGESAALATIARLLRLLMHERFT
tara:strand:- start:171 stop:383 length:213 start_codon:yes stop_codon:yes gene_type:complete